MKTEPGHSSISANEHHDGLTKREYFAAMAMQGFMASDGAPDVNYKVIAEAAVIFADTLINALNKKPHEQ